MVVALRCQVHGVQTGYRQSLGATSWDWAKQLGMRTTESPRRTKLQGLVVANRKRSKVCSRIGSTAEGTSRVWKYRSCNKLCWRHGSGVDAAQSSRHDQGCSCRTGAKLSTALQLQHEAIECSLHFIHSFVAKITCCVSLCLGALQQSSQHHSDSVEA